MYQRFYDLCESPFELTGDPKYLFLTSRQREALSALEYGLSAAKGLTVLVGEPGTGKTSLLRAAMQSPRCQRVRGIALSNPALTREEFVSALAAAFELGDAASQSKAVLLDALERQLRERRAAGEITALLIDEAQCLSLALLEEVRLLGNIETPTEKLLPLVLAGQPELGERLEVPALRQLKQRVALRCETAAFDLPETAAYIASRITVAGGTPSALFTQDAVKTIHEYSGGIARTINVLCDNALVGGMALGRRPVDRAIVLEVSRDFALLRQAGGADDANPAGADAKAPAAPPRAELERAIKQTPSLDQQSRPRRFPLFGAVRRSRAAR
jgi:type II secretory pathway predicted ATPase ExeA